MGNINLTQRLSQYHPKLIDLSLDRIKRLLEKLGNPQNSLPPIIHIAGTNGKGSTLAFIHSIAEAAGLRVHTYTSPHLVTFNERIRINGIPINDQDLLKLIIEVETKNAKKPLTFFEISTAIAFLAFSRNPSDLILLETGLGGRLDATNVISRPAVTALSPISNDHSHFLGHDLKSIAKEKAGIMKPGIACITAKQDPVVLDVIKKRAGDINAPLSIENDDWWVAVKGKCLSIMSRDGEINPPLPNLVGPHQIQNAGLAVVTIAGLGDNRITRQAVSKGMSTVQWPARMQKLTRGPLYTFLPADWELWLDGGHNHAAGLALAATIKSFEGGSVHLIAGLINTKVPSDFLAPLRNHAHSLTAVTIPNEESSFSANQICSIAKKLGFKAKTANSVNQAVKNIVAEQKAPSRIIICGSLYLAGSVLKENH